MQAVAPTGLQSSRLEDTYVGSIGLGGEFGVIMMIHQWTGVAFPQTRKRQILALLYRWKKFTLAGKRDIYGFARPELLDAKRLAAFKLRPEPTPTHFPLSNFVFGP